MLETQSLKLKIKQPKFYYGLIGLVLLFACGDSILLFIGHLLHGLFEFFTAILEHLLQVAFHLTKRQAQISVFYVELLVGIVTVWRLSLLVCQKCTEIALKLCSWLKQIRLIQQ